MDQEVEEPWILWAAPILAYQKVTMICPVCERVWPEGCEQAIAVEKRGKCICCIAKAGERIETDPYEFSMGPQRALPKSVAAIMASTNQVVSEILETEN